MSTPRWKKEQRQKELMAAAIRRKYEKSLAQKSGSISQKNAQKSVLEQFKEYNFPDPVGYRESSHANIDSVNTGAGVAPASNKKEYTGTYVKGIMESHKSNLLPVVDDEHIVAITQMRRN